MSVTQPTHPAAPPPPSKRRLPTIAIIGIVLGSLLLLYCVGGLALNLLLDDSEPQGKTTTTTTTTAPAITTTSTPDQPPTTEAPPPPPPTPAGPATTFADGTYEVGKDVQAGSYTCKAGAGGGYWERNKDASGEFESIIANNNVNAGAQDIVAIKAKEFFKVNGLTCTIR